MTIDNMNSRLAFQNAMDLLVKNVGTMAAANARLTPSYIRAEVLASTTTAKYQIQTLVNEVAAGSTGTFNTERRLALQDWFICSQIGLFLAVPSSATDTSFRLLTYPDPTVLTTSGAAVAANTLYQGYMQLIIDNNKVMPEWDTDRHYVVPFQQSAANADYTTSGINYIGSRNGSEDGYYPCEPNLVFNGAASLDFSLNLPSAISTLQSGGFQRIVVIMRGHKAQNVTNVK